MCWPVVGNTLSHNFTQSHAEFRFFGIVGDGDFSIVAYPSPVTGRDNR